MDETTTTTSWLNPDFGAASARLHEAGDRILDASRKMTGAYLDGVERSVAGMTDFERKLGDQVQIEPVGTALSAHAKLTDEITSASLSAARELISA